MAAKSMTYQEAADYLGIGVRTLQRHVTEGEVAYIELGGKYWFEEKDLEEFRHRYRREATK